MHVPDGFLDAPTSVATGAVAVGGRGVALRGARTRARRPDRPAGRPRRRRSSSPSRCSTSRSGRAPAVTCSGGALAAVLVGPVDRRCCASAWCCSCRRCFFADGGITALGTNITLMALVTVVVGWLVFRVLRAVLPKRRRPRSPPAAAIGGLRLRARCGGRLHRCSTRSAAPSPSTPATLATAMLGWHMVIGIGEARRSPAWWSAACVAVRPDLVYGARGVLAEPRRSRSADGGGRHEHGREAARGVRSPSASLSSRCSLAGVGQLLRQQPPRRARVRRRRRPASSTAPTSTPPADSPLADYGTKGVDDARLSGGLAGVVGHRSPCSSLAGGLFWRRRRRRDRRAGRRSR